MRAHRRAQSARPQGMSLANLLPEAKGGACPEWHLDKEILEKNGNFSITRGRQMNENVSQSFGLGFENGNSRKNHPCPALLRSYEKCSE